jgi:hypothetical protein
LLLSAGCAYRTVGLSWQENIMTFVVALTNTLRGWRIPTPQQRADHYVSWMPIAVVAPSAELKQDAGVARPS